ncbi:MAG: hypothetical protein WBC93_09995 [Sulfitobacter sp.]
MAIKSHALIEGHLKACFWRLRLAQIGESETGKTSVGAALWGWCAPAQARSPNTPALIAASHHPLPTQQTLPNRESKLHAVE